VHCIYPIAIGIISTIQQSYFVSAGNSNLDQRNQNKKISTINMVDVDDQDEDRTEVGGGAVNEKKRLYYLNDLSSPRKLTTLDGGNVNPSSPSYNPIEYRSHLLHAIEGLNRYPNYLSRWNEDDIESLELALEERLQQVRSQKLQVQQRREEMKHILRKFLQKYTEYENFVQPPQTWEEIQSTILDPRANQAIFRSKFFRRKQQQEQEDTVSVQDVVSGKVQVELDTAYLQEWMDEEFYDVYSFPLLSSTFCHKLHTFVSAVLHFMTTTTGSIKNEGSSVKLNRGIHKDLDNMGMGWLNDLLFHLIVRPISAQLYKETDLAGGDLDWRQAFIASYSATPTHSKPRQRLVPHTDDAEVSPTMVLVAVTNL
jgi:uncharacterized protein (UPF0305 family)